MNLVDARSRDITETKGNKTMATKKSTAKKAAPKKAAKPNPPVKGAELVTTVSDTSMFKAPTDDGFKTVSRPPTVKPAQWPDGAAIQGEVVDVHQYTPDKQKNPAIVITIQTGADQKVCIYATAVIKAAYGLKADDEKSQKSLIGKLVQIIKTGERLPSKQGQDAWEFICRIKE
jgi:hypothetical protein